MCVWEKMGATACIHDLAHGWEGAGSLDASMTPVTVLFVSGCCSRSTHRDIPHRESSMVVTVQSVYTRLFSVQSMRWESSTLIRWAFMIEPCPFKASAREWQPGEEPCEPFARTVMRCAPS